MKWSPYPYVVLLLIPMIPSIGYMLGMPWLFLVATFVGIPFLDWAFGVNHEPFNFSAKDIQFIEAVLKTYVVLHVFLIFFGMWLVHHYNATWWQFLLVAGSTGFACGGQGWPIAHELGHAQRGWKRVATRVLLACHCYGMWRAEHNRAHHVKAATPDDTVYSPKNQSIYEFMPKAIIGSYINGVKVEAEALRNKGLNPWNPKHNEVFRIFIGTGLFLVASYALAGWMGVAFFLFQGFVSIQVLESVQYVQHYGLLREKGEDGKYERMQPRHSWNSAHRFANYMTINLMRHSDHHANPGLAYHELRSHKDAPQLMSGYPGMIAMALVPPLWFKVMNPRLEKYLAEQDGKAVSSKDTQEAQPA